MSKFKLTHVSNLVQQIALSGLDFVMAAMDPANDVKMEVNKATIFASQAEVATMMVKALTAAIEKDEACLASSYGSDPSLN